MTTIFAPRFFFNLCIFCLLGSKLIAQSTGDLPSNTKWKYIENENVKVIFTDSLEAEAIRTADIIDYIQKNKSISVGDKSKKIDLLIYPHTIVSNGFTSLAPYKIGVFGTAFQNNFNLGSLNWIDGLAIHEYRHALQFNNARHGFTKFSYYLTGESGWALSMFQSVPDWYFEGDAVLSETLLSDSGRGRLPSFFEEQRALLLENKMAPYSEARNGSYKDLLPNHYPLGFAIVNYGRNHFGDKLWSKVLADAGAYQSIFYPFSSALKKQTGLTTKKMYESAYGELKTKWEEELNRITISPLITISSGKEKAVSHYTFPHYMDDGSILCLKSSFDKTASLVQIKNGIEKELSSIGIKTEAFLSVNGNKAAWTELKKDPRRNAVNYNQIVQFDLKNNIKSSFSVKGKFFSPQFSSKGDRIIAVQADEYLNNQLVILDSNSKETKKLPNPENDFISFPKWGSDDKTVFYIAKRNSKIALLKLNLETNKQTNLTPWSSNAIGNFTVYKDKIYFSATYSGINNIYCVDTEGSEKIFSITSVKVGADMPSVSKDGKDLIFCELSSKGKQIKKMALSNALNVEIQRIEPTEMPRYQILTTAVEHSIIDSIPKNNYFKKDYKGFLKGVKLHSWSSTISNTDLGLNLWFDSILNDFSAVIGGNYNLNENKLGFTGSINYAKYWIPIQINWNATDRSYNSSLGYKVNFKENIMGLAFSLPLSQYSGNYLKGILLKTSINKITTSKFHVSDYYFDNNLNFNSLKIGLTLYNIRQKALQNTTNRWSQYFNFEFNKSLNNHTKAEKVVVNIKETFGGIGKNDVFELNFRAKKEWNHNDYLYLDNFEHSRGYPISANDSERVLSANYSFPLAYPHFGAAGILYTNRIIANLFCDLGSIKISNQQYKQNSFGAEIIFNLKMLNVLLVSLGFRNSYLLNTNNYESLNKYQFGLFVSSKF